MEIQLSKNIIFGQCFGRYTAIAKADPYIHPKGHERQRVTALCECGRVRAVREDSLITGKTLSCGCFHRDKMITHGRNKSKEHSIWGGMKDRVLNPNSVNFGGYQGRGISISESWKSFENFYADMGPCPKGFTLHRVDNDGDYCKENCIWADDSLQNHVKRNWGNCQYKGVSYKTKRKIYEANIRKDNKSYYLGRSEDPLVCAVLYDNASEELYGDRPNGTKPE